jgi:hypothetical protein
MLIDKSIMFRAKIYVNVYARDGREVANHYVKLMWPEGWKDRTEEYQSEVNKQFWNRGYALMKLDCLADVV